MRKRLFLMGNCCFLLREWIILLEKEDFSGAKSYFPGENDISQVRKVISSWKNVFSQVRRTISQEKLIVSPEKLGLTISQPRINRP